MAACPEEKSSSPKEPFKICSENTVNHERRKNCYNEFSNFSKNHENFSEIGEKSNPDVNTLSEDEFLQLMIEASTFNKSSKQESALLKKLRIDNPITETEPSDKVKLGTHSQFPVHKNTRTYVGNHSLPSGASHSRTVDGRKKHSRNKDDSHIKGALNALQKGIHQSQSLQDLMSSDLSRSKQRPRKAHRTHSLSSDEVSGIDADSLTILKKLGKKSHRQSKSDTNKTNNSAGGRNNGVSNHCPVSDIANSGADSAGDSSPVEIEMEELKSGKTSDDGSGKEVERSSNGVAQGNSKFYVDCNDIDSTVSFPLKLVSSIDDQNNEIVGDPLKRFPIVPWPRPLQVQSFFSSLPMDPADTFLGNDKQILNADINGNPFTRNTRPSNLASFVSSTLMDYSGNNGIVSETKNRKNKRLRNSVNKGVLSENIAGHRGEEDIDSLLQFINSSDKKAKSAVKGSSQMMSTKSSLLHDNERKKSFGKEMKNCHKNVINVVKKDLKRSSSLENISSTKISNDMADVFLFEPRGSASDLPTKDSITAPSDNLPGKILDINSNEENKFTQIGVKGRESSTSESSFHNSGASSSPEVSSFAADFYSTADVSSQTIEESGFSVVKKKQRKKHPGKRSESYRWRNAQAQRKKGMLLPLAESKCGKQDTRRKSTSSVPHSEHSSADNSDLDSVHSLPVRGSVPHPTQSHPHTTPSSSSSTPQASYADIARMPTSKLPSPSIGRPIDHDARRADSKRGRALLGGREDLAGKGSVPAPPTESDSTDVKVRSHTKSTREINTQTEPESAAVGDEVKTETSKKCEESSKNECSSCSSRKNACSCSKFQLKAKGADIPPVIMDNMPPESNPCNVSFGFGIEEVLRMVPVDSSFDLEQKDIGETSKAQLKSGEMSETVDGVSELPSANSKTDMDPCSKSSTELQVLLKLASKQDLSPEQSSHLKKVCYGTDRNICYNETKVNVKRFNHLELTRFLGNEFYSIENEIKGISGRRSRGGRAEYYVDSSEEA